MSGHCLCVGYCPMVGQCICDCAPCVATERATSRDSGMRDRWQETANLTRTMAAEVTKYQSALRRIADGEAGAAGIAREALET